MDLTQGPPVIEITQTPALFSYFLMHGTCKSYPTSYPNSIIMSFSACVSDGLFIAIHRVMKLTMINLEKLERKVSSNMNIDQ
jgi:hypothetical protein